jgi:hypothetical protein
VKSRGVATESRESVIASRALTTAFGLLLVAIADFRARRGMEPSEPFFWLGLVVIALPIGLLLWSPRGSRGDRIGLVLLLGLGLELVRVFYNPNRLAFYDEFSHWRTAIDIATSSHLFLPNPLQPISAYYPGLEALTVAFAEISGLSLTEAGVLVIAIGRIVLVLALFMMFERVSRSRRAAGAAVLLYTANPSFVFFDAQFSYESLAVPLAVVAAAVLATRTPSRARTALARALLSGVAIAAVVVTHHVTSFALVALLGIWAVVGRLLGRRAAGKQVTPVTQAVLAAAAAAAWLVLVSPLTVSYVAPHIIGGFEQLIQLMNGESTGRRLFEDATGVPASLVERVVGYIAVFLILVALPVALWSIRRFYGRSPMAIAMGLVALGYPASLGLRLTTAGAEAAGRLSAFVFVGVAFAIAVWGTRVTSSQTNAIPGRLLAIATTAVFVGGVVVGFAPWARLPFPYRPAADSRSVEPEGLTAAAWTAAQLGPHHVFLTDRTNRQLLGTYGYQDPTYTYPALVLLLSPTVSEAGIRTIASNHIEYVLADRRLGFAEPLVGAYRIGRDGGLIRSALDPAAFTKFDVLPAISRVFDSGDIQIFDLKELW